MTQVKNFHIFVEGRVQAVGYRRFAYQRAKALGLRGWVRNLLDGRVEIQVSIPPEISNEQREQFFADLKRGPAFSMVRELTITPIDGQGGQDRQVEKQHDQDFEIRPDEVLGGQ